MKLLLVTLNQPQRGQRIHVDGQLWWIESVSFSGTVAQLNLTPTPASSTPSDHQTT